jgi:glutathione S-transferase
MITLFDADRCPYCARVRIVLAEKEIPHETVTVDLGHRPGWLYEKNPLGKVPVLEEDGLCIPESAVIMELLEERFPEPALLPLEPAQRAIARAALWQFETLFAHDYYAARRGEDVGGRRLAGRLTALDERLNEWPYLGGFEYGLADIGWFPWLPRAEVYLGLDLAGYPALGVWLERLSKRPAVAAELEVVSALVR